MTKLIKEYIVTEPTKIDGVLSNIYNKCPNCDYKYVRYENLRCPMCKRRLVFVTDLDIED